MKTDSDNQNKSGKDVQIADTYVAIILGFVTVLFSVISPRFQEDLGALIALILLAFAGIFLFFAFWQRNRPGLKALKLFYEMRKSLAVYVLAWLAYVAWLLGFWQTVPNVTAQLTRFFEFMLQAQINMAIFGAILILIAAIWYLDRRKSNVEKQRLEMAITQSNVAEAQREMSSLALERGLQDRLLFQVKLVGRMSGEIYDLEGIRREIAQDSTPYIDGALSLLNQWKKNKIEKVIYYDPRYPSAWGSNLEEAVNVFVSKRFVRMNADELAEWMFESIQGLKAHRCVALFVQDIVPDTVVEVLNDTCMLRQFLNLGGRVVWRGDIPLYYRGKRTGARERLDVEGPRSILAVSYDNFAYTKDDGSTARIWDSGLHIEVTDAGKDLGLPDSPGFKRGVLENQVSVVYARNSEPLHVVSDIPKDFNGYFAVCWKKNFNPRYPYSGFMQYYLDHWRTGDIHDISPLYAFALSGWPLYFFSTPSISE